MTENRHGLVVRGRSSARPHGTTEREAAQDDDRAPFAGRSSALTLGADKAYDAREFVDDLRRAERHAARGAECPNRDSAIDGRTTRHAGYAISQQKRKRVEEPFGWAKTIGGLRQADAARTARRLGFKFTLTMAAYDLVRLPKLIGAAA